MGPQRPPVAPNLTLFENALDQSQGEKHVDARQ